METERSFTWSAGPRYEHAGPDGWSDDADARYSVSVIASPTRAKVSIGSNPWNPDSTKHNLATLAEQYGGGGHPRVSAISFEPEDIERAKFVAQEIAEKLRR